MSDVLDEAVRLLGALRFTTERGATARGTGVHVVVDPEWDAGGRCFCVSLLCVAPAVDRPGWAAMPLLLERVQAFVPPAAAAVAGTSAGGVVPASGPARAPQPARAAVQGEVAAAAPLAIATRLDRRGHATLRAVPPGEYRLIAGASWVQARAPLSLPRVLVSADRRLTVSLRSDTAAQVEITVETAGLPARATARFHFFARDDRVLLQDELDLARSGRWRGRVDLDAVGGFACQLLGDADRPGATI